MSATGRRAGPLPGPRRGRDERFATLQLAIDGLSRQAYRTLTGQEPPEAPLCFSSADTISGKFVELYFRAMLGRTE